MDKGVIKRPVCVFEDRLFIDLLEGNSKSSSIKQFYDDVNFKKILWWLRTQTSCPFFVGGSYVLSKRFSFEWDDVNDIDIFLMFPTSLMKVNGRQTNVWTNNPSIILKSDGDVNVVLHQESGSFSSK